ncbi:MAG TPA: MBL fold metallo-hydrolase [Bacteroidales bacterium]|nr:MBL fold metallo-hydrolase [Bacteroidales bacterium]
MKTWSTSTGNKVIQILSGRSNVFLLANNQSRILIDTGPGSMWTALQRRLDRLQIRQVDLLILTHSHFDHAANAARIKEKYKARVIIHQTETKYLASGDNILPVGTNIVAKFLVKTIAKQFNSIAGYSPCDYDITFDYSFELTDYGFNGYLVHTPGHTQGSISVIIDNEIALVGDTMFGIFWGTVFPPFASDQNLLIKSWGKLLETRCRLFIPSHGSANKRHLVEKDYSGRISAKRQV